MIFHSSSAGLGSMAERNILRWREGTRVMLKALGIAFLLVGTALSQTTNLPSSSRAAETQMAESPHASRPDALGTIDGVVTDGSGSVVAGAVVTLESAASAARRMTVDGPDRIFPICRGRARNIHDRVAALVLRRGQPQALWSVRTRLQRPLTLAVLQVASASTKVDVGLPQKELAAEQLKAEEKQRLLGDISALTSSAMNRMRRR